ncbi:HAD-IIB family hydrolase [Paenibacillus mendelii]|uniref:HAD-IIB family hydrolase n=1 Tax=Paenibacillus mendelii TaxID=206163 RepID=A0ABV6JEJ5_9BACL|nr:HAD-IIB family hydrolase [Paenibacillus mendelii]MCQ6562920.1 HAD family hydrolase [Paenibacillus mendelii]
MSVLYISDLDGTLLNDEQLVSPESVEILNDLIDRGMLFTVATARSIESASWLLRDLSLRLPVAYMNGVFIHDPLTRRNIRSNFLPDPFTMEVLAAYMHNDLQPLLYTLDDNGVPHVYYKGIRNASEENYITSRTLLGDSRFQLVTGFDNHREESVLTVNAIDTLERLLPVYEAFRYRSEAICHFGPDIYTPGYYWLEIANSQANKRDACIFLKQYADASKLVCFGDNLNDLPMFEAADEKYAVSNAHEQVIQAASGTILANAEHGVAHYLASVYGNKP